MKRKKFNFKHNELLKYYFYWMVERQKIFWRRLEGDDPPFSKDDIFNRYKFTNVYRILDRSSQKLVRIFYGGNQYLSDDILFRMLVFKHFNSPVTWDMLEKTFGEITLNNCSFEDISQAVIDYDRHYKIFRPYNNAYMLTTAFFIKGGEYEWLRKKYPSWKKHQYYFYIYEKEIFETDFLSKLLIYRDNPEKIYNLWLSVTGFATFMAYQYTVDTNYSPLASFDENEFVACGIGTKRGIDRTFDFEGKPKYEAVVHWLHENFEQLMWDYGYYKEWDPLPGHQPTKTDLLNCFCEVDKYLRVKGVQSNVSGKRMKNPFRMNPKTIEYMFPPKWNLNV